MAAIVVVLGIVTVVVVGLSAAALWWRTDAGLQWALRQVPGLQVIGPRGRPDGGSFGAERLQWQSPTLTLTIDQLAWRDLQWHWRPHPGTWIGVTLVEPRARGVVVRTRPDPQGASRAAAAPRTLQLPLELALQGVAVGTLTVDDLPPVEALMADLHLGHSGGTVHRVRRLAARVGQLQAQAQLTVHGNGDLPLSGQLTVTGVPGAVQPLEARVDVSGTLPRVQLAARLDAGAGAQAQARATLAPFDRWPLLALQARTRDLDLSVLAAGLPTTGLTGTAVVESQARDEPVSVQLDFSNAMPGPWSASRLPVQSVRAAVQGTPSDLGTLDLSALDVRLHGTRPAGRVQGTGRWQDTTLSVALELSGVDASRLHDAGAPVTLGGPLRLRVDGLPAPAGTAPAAAASGLTATLQAELAGTLRRGGTRPVQLALDGTAAWPEDGSLHMRDLRVTLEAGRARAAVEADLQRLVAGAWQGRTRGQLTRFDPTDWWAGPADAPGWRRGPHGLNGSWDASFTVPPGAAPASAGGTSASAPGSSPMPAPSPHTTPAAPPLPLRDRLLALRVDGTARLRDSRLAGVPLRADLAVQADGRRAQLAADVGVAGATVEADITVASDPRSDRGQVRIDAPALAALSPLFQLVPGSGTWAPRGGSVQLDASAAGAWPAVRTEGRLQAAGIDGGRWTVGTAQARWTAEPGNPDAPLSLSLQAASIAQGEQRIDRVDLELDGTLREHRLALQARSPLRPPAWTDAALPERQATSAGGRLSVRGSGRWAPATTGGIWRIDTVEAVAAPAAEGASPWLQASDVQATLRIASDASVSQVTLAPHALTVLGATLRWQQATYEAPRTPGAPPRMAVEASLDPLPIAPWLARFQPDTGWAGDLRVGGRVTAATTAGGFEADVLLERADGDLLLSDSTGPRPLGMTALRLSATARDGVWTLRQAVQAGSLGDLAGTQTLRTDPGAVVPGSDAVLDGELALRVPDIGAWSSWLPAGWRMGGRVAAEARLGGRLGAPEYRGRVTGRTLAVANLLQGIQWTDGDLALTLDGDTATLERLVFRGGDGSVRAEGGARFGESPQAQLQITADRLLALGRVDRRVVVSGQAGIQLGADRVALQGLFTIDRGRIDISQSDAPSLDTDVTLAPIPGQVDVAIDDAATPDLLARADVQLTIDLGQDLRLRGRGLDTLLKGRLQVSTPGGELAVAGTVRTDEGSYTAYGQNLAIERGIITFTGDVATPRLDILAVRPDIDIRVGVAVQGSAIDPRVRLFSEPEMSEIDKLSWIVMGRAPEGVGRAEAALLQRAALALLAGEGGGPQGGALERLGLDELSVAQGDSGELSDTVVTVGKQLSRRWFVAYERGLNAAAGSWQLIYRAARRFTLRAQSGDDSAVDVIWTWRWN